MVKLEVIAFGKAKNSEFIIALKEFEKRLGKIIKITELNAVKGDNQQQILTSEEKIILPYLNNNDYKIILDSTGKTFSSLEFSKTLTDLANNSKNIKFFLGSSFGFSDNVKKQADLMLSLSKMTMPHILARLVLIEQIYRAIMINKNHPYHK